MDGLPQKKLRMVVVPEELLRSLVIDHHACILKIHGEFCSGSIETCPNCERWLNAHKAIRNLLASREILYARKTRIRTTTPRN
jgi:hypothetical protein